MQPVTIEVRCGWSNSSKQSEGYVQAVYSSLQKLQTARKPFDVVTGKRSYKNMLVRSLIIRTDEKSEFALMAVALCQEAIIVHTSGTGTGPPGAGGGPGRPPSGAGPKGSVSITDGNASTEDWQISTQSAAVESWPNLIGSVSNSQLALSGTEVTAFQ